jgi:hypothetical protein
LSFHPQDGKTDRVLNNAQNEWSKVENRAQVRELRASVNPYPSTLQTPSEGGTTLAALGGNTRARAKPCRVHQSANGIKVSTRAAHKPYTIPANGGILDWKRYMLAPQITIAVGGER